MEIIELDKNDVKKILLKKYVDGSIKIIQKFKTLPELNEELYLNSESVEILKSNLA